jgi:glycosyltransferase involved in cell wall biosynthesis
MKYAPIISIIIPVYNAEKYILRCLDSIQNQTFLDYEVILINDGSIDNSREILESYIGNKANWTLINKANEGTSHTRNLGLIKAKGSYVCFIDIDDFIEEKYLEKLYNSIAQNKCELACCGYIDHSSHGVINLNNYSEKSSNIIDVKEFTSLMFSNIGGVLWDKIFDANIIRSNNLKMNHEIYYFEDSLFILDYLKHTKNIFIIGDCLYNYNRINETSFTNKIDWTWIVNIVNFNNAINAKLIDIGCNKNQCSAINKKNVTNFIIVIFQSEKLKYVNFKEKKFIISQIISNKFLKKNFTPHRISKIYAPYSFFVKFRLLNLIVFYAAFINFLKSTNNRIKITNMKKLYRNNFNSLISFFNLFTLL